MRAIMLVFNITKQKDSLKKAGRKELPVLLLCQLQATQHGTRHLPFGGEKEINSRP
jgi:hypothetical protein